LVFQICGHDPLLFPLSVGEYSIVKGADSFRNRFALLKQSELAYLAHSARADMYRRLGRPAEARSSYEKALALTQQEPEPQFLQERIRQLK
jgi:predicted RNA polymerase sigma factor